MPLMMIAAIATAAARFHPVGVMRRARPAAEVAGILTRHSARAAKDQLEALCSGVEPGVPGEVGTDAGGDVRVAEMAVRRPSATLSPATIAKG